ncbi:FitA-like ribbon-helix-helix domain-containing protein [Luteipulveratus halotolerans]|uniref:Antitoxin FitA-like ribbon-helix-helix domain-containing protein n=1 Tax=Luteipulveratus halotolerans TaxID=1631356 RepID=A0A0L6CNH8_9MICO|nr:Arc family DNA-binding protein [Luteipulveratus halotolerans]KNX39341.1 hypothetical protein VV01_09410 [Luteipulveratus halotolerans]
MATITVRDLDDGVRDRLKVRAAEHGRSMEAEVRQILTDKFADAAPGRTLGAISREFRAATGGFDLRSRPEGSSVRGVADFSDDA